MGFEALIAGGEALFAGGAADAAVTVGADAVFAGEAGAAAGGVAGAGEVAAGVASDAGLATAADASAAGGGLTAVGAVPDVAGGGAVGATAIADPLAGGLVAPGAGEAVGGGLATGAVDSSLVAGSGGGALDTAGFETAGGGGADSSIFTGANPTDIPNPIADQTIAPADAAAGGNPAIQGALDKAVKYGPLALGGAQALMGGLNSKKYAKEFGNIGGTQRDVANQMIAEAQSGKINPADQFAIDQWAQGAIAQAKNYYAKAGLSNSSMATQAISDINNQAAAMKEKARQDLLTTGMSALNIVDQYQAKAIAAEMQGDQAAATNATNFLNAYGNWLRATSSTGQAGQKPPPAGA